MGFHKTFILYILALLVFGSGCDRHQTSRRTDPAQTQILKSRVDRDAPTPDQEVFRLAALAAATFNVPDKRHIVVIDYDRSLYAERLFVVDMRKKKIVLRSPVSHALNSGRIFATEFSNISASRKSCVGAFMTAEVYHGKFGYSLRVDGLQKGVNDNARARAIVFHDYEAAFAYSDGCFMTKPDLNRQLIDLVRGGCLVFVRKTEADGISTIPRS